MAAKRSRKAKPRQAKPQKPPPVRLSAAEKMAGQILNPFAAARGEYVMVDVANHTTADMRDAESLKRTKTVRRTTKISQLAKAGILSTDQARICEWFKDQHTRGYEAGQGTTARYGESSGGGGNHSHLPRDLEQGQARMHYLMAYEGVHPMLRPLLTRVLIDDRPIGRLNISFRLGVRQLVERVIEMGVAA